MNTEEILTRLDGVFETSIGWAARCPSHDDARASLSVAEVGGKTLIPPTRDMCTLSRPPSKP